MNELKLGAIESRFADIIWHNEPISTSKLISICENELKWKRTTTYTVLKRLSERGLFQNTDGIVTSLVSRNEFFSEKSRRFVDETFDGSLPRFLTAFSMREKLSENEICELQRLIDESRR